MRIYKRGSTYWTEFMVDNKRYQLSCKTKEKKLAEEIASALQSDVVRKKFDIPAKYKVEKTFGGVWEDYIQNLNNTSRTIQNKNIVFKHIFQFFNNKNIAEINQSDIKTYQLSRKIEYILKNTGKREQDINFRWINLEISTLHNFLNFCIEKGYLDKNPATGIKKLNELSRLKTLSDEDINKLIAGATNKLTKDLIPYL